MINLTVAWITLRALLGRKRALLLIPLPLVVAFLTALAHAADPDAAHWAQPLIGVLGFAAAIPIVALIVGTSVVGSEIDDGTIVHILTKPLSRSSIVATKLAVAALVTGVVNGVMMFAVGVMASSLRFGVAIGLAAVVGSICYCAVFVMMSLLTRRSALIGLLYIVLWEGLLGNFLTGTRPLSIQQLSRTFAAKISGADLVGSTVSLPVAIVMSCVFVVLGTVIAVEGLRSFTLAGETS